MVKGRLGREMSSSAKTCKRKVRFFAYLFEFGQKPVDPSSLDFCSWRAVKKVGKADSCDRLAHVFILSVLFLIYSFQPLVSTTFDSALIAGA